MDPDFRATLSRHTQEPIRFRCLVTMKRSYSLADRHERKTRICLLWSKELDTTSLRSKICVELVTVRVFRSCIEVCFLIFFGNPAQSFPNLSHLCLSSLCTFKK